MTTLTEALSRLLELNVVALVLTPAPGGCLEAVAAVRREPRGAVVPILVLGDSGLSPTELPQLYRLGGIDCFPAATLPEVVSAKLEGFVALAWTRQSLAPSSDTTRALEESEGRLKLALEAARLGDWSWDAITDVVTLSLRASEILGIPPGTRLTWSEQKARMWVEDRDLARQIVERAMAERTDYNIDYRVTRPDGTECWVASRGRAEYDPTGQITGIRGVVQDVTDQKRLVESLKEADKRKDEFLAILAHELRNPLAPIRNAVEIMKLIGPRDPALVQARDMIERQSGHMSRLIDDLLDVSRISQGKILLRKETVNLVDLVRSAVEDQRPMIENGGLHLSVSLPARSLWVQGDPTRLLQIVVNLLQNAAKFTDLGGNVALEVSSEGEFARLVVRDTGIGWEPGMIEFLFAPFQQAERSVDRSRGGLGLGLALVKGLVELHGGTTTATSDGPGHGAQFVVKLPMVEISQPASQSVPPPHVPRRHLRVLVIEDNRDAAESLRMLLQFTGHEVRLAFTGLAGIEAAREFRPQVILCDIGLPGGMDGYAVARVLRNDRDLCRTSLIALTGFGRDEDQHKARQAGFDRHLIKPVDPAMLTRILESTPMQG